MTPTDILRRLAEARERGAIAWLVTVVATGGSAPAQAGMKMIFFSDGSVEGTVGGGELERQVCRKILDERPREIRCWSFDLGLPGGKGGEKTGMPCGGMQEVLVEYFGPVWRLAIVGGGHCGVALSALAARVGFTVTVIDDRPEWANAEKHPSAAEVVCADYDSIERHIDFAPDLFIVIMTYDHLHDELVLRRLLGRECRYLGLIGSRQKIKSLLERLKADGVPEGELKKLFAPVGFAIGSHAPDEIAISILAQMIAVRSGVDRLAFNANPLFLSAAGGS